MLSILESHLALLEEQAEPVASTPQEGESQRVEDIIAVHLGLLDALERHIGENGVTEAHRPLVPLFQRWLETARRVKALVIRLRAIGQSVANLDDLLRAMNRSKPVAQSFDHFVALNARIARGEPGEYIPLTEVLEKLRGKPAYNEGVQ